MAEENQMLKKNLVEEKRKKCKGFRKRREGQCGRFLYDDVAGKGNEISWDRYLNQFDVIRGEGT